LKPEITKMNSKEEVSSWASKTDVFIFLFAIKIPDSFENVKFKLKLLKFQPKARSILIGFDRPDQVTVNASKHFWRRFMNPIQYKDAITFAGTFNAEYFECDLETGTGFSEISKGLLRGAKKEIMKEESITKRITNKFSFTSNNVSEYFTKSKIAEKEGNYFKRIKYYQKYLQETEGAELRILVIGDGADSLVDMFLEAKKNK